ncbi:ABC-type sugar transport system, periplasmic component [Halobacteroides halobius DSM 5150]|uniref:ABC-type sugar transport system, periplasmic component n=1 Tax=Halobacteroides halobius (strain ATCC 35273 / DSM 5150 / MD-1) TaxID=748449 RepID=L0K431_HALHC|nr:substrate-binding domain-containing protein [Halobacteroides halobius]AGB40047.1 ABC-type sugar transport system, periplasmic component [Halobacteroides halobius DSM 5150]
MKRLYVILILFTVVTIGCNLNIERINPLTSSSPKKEITIGVSIASTRPNITEIIKKAFIKDRNKQNINILWQKNSDSIKKQKEDVISLIKQEVDIIIIKLLKINQQSKEIIKLINENSIPVVALDKLPPNTKVAAYVSANNFKVGKSQAQYLIDQINKKGNILILKGDKDDKKAQDITAGNKTILKKHKKIKIIKEKWHNNWSEQLANLTVRQTIKENKKIKAILANSDQLALEAIKVLQKEKINKEIIVIGANASKKGTIALIKGDMSSTVDQMPYIRGLNALKVATFIARKEKWNWDGIIKNGKYNIKLITTPIKLINKYNVKRLKKRWQDL